MPYRSPEERREYMRQYTLKKRSGPSGIYTITCIANKKIYVGSAVCLSNRKQQHWDALKRGNHDNSMLQNAWNKYGSDTFVWEVVELVEVERLIEREQHFIDSLNTTDRSIGFNLAPKAGSMLGFKLSPESRAKIAAAHRGKKQSPEAIEKRVAAVRGRKQTPERIEKRTAPQRGVKRKPLSVEQRAKQSAALKGRRPKNLETLWSGDSLAKRVEKNRGRQRTPEQKARILAGILEGQQRRKEQGIPHPSLGIPRDPETITKIAAANRGKKRSPETRAKMAAAKRGVKQSPEVVAKRTAAIREANLRRKAEAARLKAEQRAEATFLRTGIKPAPPENPKRETQGKLFD